MEFFVYLHFKLSPAVVIIIAERRIMLIANTNIIKREFNRHGFPEITYAKNMSVVNAACIGSDKNVGVACQLQDGPAV